MGGSNAHGKAPFLKRIVIDYHNSKTEPGFPCTNNNQKMTGDPASIALLHHQVVVNKGRLDPCQKMNPLFAA
jgi:hypothetical protein